MANRTVTPELTAADVTTAIRRYFGAEHDNIGPEWAALDEFTLEPGPGYRRADLFLVRAWGGRPRGHERIVVEVKVSRSDLATELANPHKAAPFERVTHRFYLATPAGLVRDDDPIPAHWGLLEVTGSGCRKVREAQRREPEPMPEGALVEAFRRAARAEARIRSAADDDPAARVVDLVRQAATATEAADRARAAASRDRERLNGWLRLVAEAGGVPCVCGARLARSLGASYYGEHKHADGSGCTANRWGTAQVDVDVLAKALGLPERLEDPS